MNVSESIRRRMDQLGISQRELAERTGINHAAIQRYVSGSTPKIPIDRLQIMAKHLHTTAEELLGWQVPTGTQRINQTRLIPVLGRIACGSPILAEENIDRMMAVPDQIACNYILECRGDSMTEAGINDGDLVYIRAQPDVEDGEIAVVMIDNDATLKRVYHHGSVIQLVPCNSKYPPQILTEKDGPVRIEGKVVAYTHII